MSISNNRIRAHDELCRLQAIGRALICQLVCKPPGADTGGRHRRRNAYLLKIGAKSFGDGIQLICKDTESNLGRFAGFKGCNYPEVSFL